MWGLDRLTAQATSTNSPLPRHDSWSQASRRPLARGPGALPPRPGVNPRTSSLSLASPNGSNTSLARGPNGADRMRPGGGAGNPSDPVQMLESMMGGPPRRPAARVENGAVVDRPESIDSDLDFGGLSLKAFATEFTRGARRPSVMQTTRHWKVEEFDRDKDSFENLHHSISACDDVLKSVELYLTNFQADLRSVSAEIESLQNRSIALNTKLDNRKVVEKILGPAVENIGISPAVVRKIAEGPVDEGFLRALAEVEQCSKFVTSKTNEKSDLKALSDTQPLLEQLTNRAIERIRDYIVAQIKAIRSPSINAQIIQQQAFLQYKDLYTFLTKHNSELASQICQAYVYTMRWYYLNHFTRYKASLEKIKVHNMDKYDVLGEEPNSKRGGNILSSNRAGAPSTYDAFALGRRMDTLRTPSTQALPSHIAEEEKLAHHIETPFRNFNLALIDNASFEYTFLSTYFSPGQTHHALLRTFASIFEPSFALGQSLTKQLVESTTDTLGVLLCVRLNQHFAFELQRRKIPAAEGYTNATNMLLWPRFQQITDMHCASLQKLTLALPSRPSAGAGALLNTTSSASASSTAPTPLTQKFANLIHGILTLSSEAGDNEPVSVSIGRLRSEYEAYLTKLSKALVGDVRRRERFLSNNYTLVCTISADIEGKMGMDFRSHFEGLRDAFDR